MTNPVSPLVGAEIAADLRQAAEILDREGWKPTLPSSTGNFAEGPGLTTNQAVTTAVTGHPAGDPHASLTTHLSQFARCRGAMAALRNARVIDHENVWQQLNPDTAKVTAALRRVAGHYDA